MIIWNNNAPLNSYPNIVSVFNVLQSRPQSRAPLISSDCWLTSCSLDPFVNASYSIGGAFACLSVFSGRRWTDGLILCRYSCGWNNRRPFYFCCMLLETFSFEYFNIKTNVNIKRHSPEHFIVICYSIRLSISIVYAIVTFVWIGKYHKMIVLGNHRSLCFFSQKNECTCFFKWARVVRKMWAGSRRELRLEFQVPLASECLCWPIARTLTVVTHLISRVGGGGLK